MKKILSLTLVLVLVLGSFPMAFADNHMNTSFSDVEDEDVETALNRLKAFGVVDGYEDGTYKPDNMITRAEFAKLLVTALGLENAANAATSSSQFTDVVGNEWYAGYVNVAAGQGIVGGYPDGSFAPNSQVTYGEAVTMLVRALNYKDEFLPGQWPSNYVAKAAELDITDDVTFFPTGKADRGSVAVLVNNTLDANIVTQKTFGDNNEWEEDKNTTLLEDKLGFDKYEESQISSVPRVDSRIDEDQIKIEGDEVKNGSYDVVEEYVLEKASNLLGLSVDVYMDDDEIVYVEESDKNFEVDFGQIDSSLDLDDEELTLIYPDGGDDDYDIDEDVKVYIDNESKDLDDVKAGMFGRVVTDNKGNVTLFDVQEFDVEAGVVTDLEKYGFEYIVDDEDIDGATEFDYEDYDKVVYRDVEGNLLELDDIEKDDVIYINDEHTDRDALEELASGDEVAYVTVVKNSTVEEADRWDDDEFRTENDTYDVSGLATVTDNEKEDVSYYGSDSEDILNTLTGDEEEVTILFDIVSDVRHIDSDVDTSSTDKYGIVTSIDWERNKDGSATGIKDLDIVNEEDEEVTYKLDFDADDFIGYDDEEEFEEGHIIKFTLNSDAEIDSAVFAAAFDGTDLDANYETDGDDFTTSGNSLLSLDDEFEEDEVEIDGTDYIISSNIKVLDIYDIGTDFEDAEIVDYDDLVGSGKAGDNVFFATDDNDEIVFLVLVGDIKDTDEFTAYVEKVFTKDGDITLDIVLPGGDTETYVANDGNADADDVEAGDLIVYTEAGGDIDIEAINSDTSDFEISKETIEKDGSYLVIDDNKYKTNSKTVYYDYDDDPIKFRDLEDGDIAYIATEGRYVKLVSRTDEAEDVDGDGDVATKGKVTYINTDENLIEVDDEVLELDSRVKLSDADGTTIAIGKGEVIAELDSLNDDGDVVLSDIVSEDGIVEKMVLAEADDSDDDDDSDDGDDTDNNINENLIDEDSSHVKVVFGMNAVSIDAEQGSLVTVNGVEASYKTSSEKYEINNLSGVEAGDMVTVRAEKDGEYEEVELEVKE